MGQVYIARGVYRGRSTLKCISIIEVGLYRGVYRGRSI